MAARNLLHKTKLQEFKKFLDAEGIAYRPGKGDYQVLQVEHPEHGWVVIYEKLHSPEHFSIPWKMVGLVEKFIKGSKPPAGVDQPRPVVKIGEYWFIKHSGATALSKVLVTDLSGLTVELQEQTLSAREMRYSLEDVQFIERISG